MESKFLYYYNGASLVSENSKFYNVIKEIHLGRIMIVLHPTLEQYNSLNGYY